MSARPHHCLNPECKRPLVASDYKGTVPDGWARHGGHGLCTACYQRGVRIEVRKAPKIHGHHEGPAGDLPHGYYLSTRPVLPADVIARAAACIRRHARGDADELLAMCGLDGAA